jgi:hypothetical protein
LTGSLAHFHCQRFEIVREHFKCHLEASDLENELLKHFSHEVKHFAVDVIDSQACARVLVDFFDIPTFQWIDRQLHGPVAFNEKAPRCVCQYQSIPK